jgi:hypothetical protein
MRRISHLISDFAITISALNAEINPHNLRKFEIALTIQIKSFIAICRQTHSNPAKEKAVRSLRVSAGGKRRRAIGGAEGARSGGTWPQTPPASP